MAVPKVTIDVWMVPIIEGIYNNYGDGTFGVDIVDEDGSSVITGNLKATWTEGVGQKREYVNPNPREFVMTIPANTLPPNQNMSLTISATWNNGEGYYGLRFKAFRFNTVRPPMMYPGYIVPSSGFQNEKERIILSWGFYYDLNLFLRDGDRIVQESAQVRWKTPEDADYHIVDVLDGSLYVYLPPNTITGESFEWGARLVGTGGIQGEWSESYFISTVDSKPTAQCVSPNSTLIYGSEDNIFRWLHEIGTGTQQSRYELEWSRNNQSWTRLAEGDGAEAECIIPANTLTAGNAYWRVRTYNTDDVASEWSEPATVLVHAAPQAPSISAVDGKPRPTVSWQSDEQQAFEVVCGDYGSGARFGAAKSFQIPVYLEDGKTEIHVRVQNRFGLWSPWATVVTTIANVPGDEIKLRTLGRPNAALLTWSGNYPKYYVYRDRKLIAKTTESRYQDNAAVGPHRYQIRGVTAEDYYTLSREVTEISRCKFPVIAKYGVFDWVPLKWQQGENPVHTFDIQAMVKYNNYVGFDRPVADIAPFQTRKHSFAFSLFERKDVERLKSLIGKPVIFKDHHQALVMGILDSFNVSPGAWSDVSFSIMESAVEEVIAYD